MQFHPCLALFSNSCPELPTGCRIRVDVFFRLNLHLVLPAQAVQFGHIRQLTHGPVRLGIIADKESADRDKLIEELKRRLGEE